jgi:transposase/regulator of replication initiation timing
MNEQVVDISETLKYLASELNSMRQTIDSQHAEICRLNRKVEAQSKEIRTLKKENSSLHKRLSKYEQPPKDSNNSSIPPSKENVKSEVVRRTNSLREKSDKSVGGQLGHQGHTRKMVDVPDEVIEHSSHYCHNCGRDISALEATLEYTTQEIDMPLIVPIIKEHRHSAKVCTCGCHNRPYAPKKRGGNDITFGKNIQALVTYLNVVQCVPYERLQSMLKTIFAIEMSQGTISNIIQLARKKAEPAIKLIKDYISKSSVVGFDESGCYCNGRLDWSWIAQTTYYTLVFRASSRAGKVLETQFGADVLKNITAVTDRHAAYFALDFKDHQICLAHILRELQYLTELDSNQDWSKKVEELLKEAIHKRNENPSKKMDASSCLKKLDDLLKLSLGHLKKDFDRLRNGLIKRKDYIFNFLENPAIPSNNNGSERGIRKLKIKQKISGTFRSDNGADAFMTIHSISDTAWKNNQSPFDAILALFECEQSYLTLAE